MKKEEQSRSKNSNTTELVSTYWEKGSCGTDHTDKPKHSLSYFEEIEEFRYRHEPYIHAFAQFTRWHKRRVLEVGVGAGTDFLQFMRAGALCSGVDLTQEAIENVSARLALYGLKAEGLQQCNAEQLPFADDTFDLVYSWGVIHHADDMEAVLREIFRVTRPGGRIKIMVYNLWSVHTLYMYVRYALLKGRLFRGPRWAIYHYQESYATKVYSKREVQRMLDNLPHQDLQFYFWDQHIRKGAKFEMIRRAY
jgi:ubiquinone/menaquinone biosynthesis C-methylase UbiE